jgi:5-methylcytosine-specific restriction endonuclease McrA
MSTQRKPIGKKLRFEVFKRDSFKCQYCGRSAPEVILHVDHIKPVKEGGTNDITNLITSCADCNLGKGAIKLDDNSALMKQKKQLDELNERREQLELMHKWQEELLSIDEMQFNYINDEFRRVVPGYSMKDEMALTVKKWIKKFGYDEVFSAVSQAAEKYIKLDENGEPLNPSNVLDNIPKICYWNKRDQENPDIGKLYYLRGIIRHRFNYWDDVRAILWLKKAYAQGATIDELKDMILSCSNWSQWRDMMDDAYQTEGNRNGN